MAQIVLITNAWGPKHGGINSFNTDFAKALSAVLAPHTHITCVVMYATEEEVGDAAKAGVKLLSLGATDSEKVDASRAINVLDAVRQDGADEVLWWVGHDVISGGVAVALPKKAGQGKSAVIHHMSYVDYTAYKQGSALAAKKKLEEQRQLFRQADEVFAVGPLLRDSLTDLLDGSKTVRMLVPGLAEIEPAPSPKAFNAITFGRLDPENDRIKQGRLAIAGFATACRKANEDELYPKALKENPRLLVIGVSPESDEEKELHAFAKQKAGRVINLLPLPYEGDRTKLFDELKRSSIAMMLSWHEGFGLTGWEAIAAEVPLIVSRKSGLYKLIDEKLGAPGLACLKDVDVRGELGDLSGGDPENFQANDEKDVSQAILKLANELDRRKQWAKQLRTLLSSQSDGYTWPNAARGFADALKLLAQAEASPERPVVTPIAYPQTSGPAINTLRPPLDEITAAEIPILKLPEPSWDRERGLAESQLLRPEELCVPFHESRRQLIDEVLTWATAVDGLPAEIQFRIGSAGAGKTRLMIEVCRELLRQGWNAGFLASTLQQDMEKTFKKLLLGQPKAFVVVDYAETRRREVVELMRVAFTGPKESRVRIMLLARDTGEWWDRLATDYPYLEKFLTGRAVRGPYRIPEVPVEEQNRETIFREALEAFASRLNKSSAGILPPDLSAPHFANVLFIHLAAMASLSGERPETATSLLEATLRHERRYWHDAARAHGLPDLLHPGLDQAVAMITLWSGAKDATAARRVLESVPRLRGARPDELDRVLEVLRIFYPMAGGVDALRPDILGERLISQELAKDDAPLEVALGKNSNEAISRSVLTVLNRLARQSPSDVLWLRRGLQQHLALRAGTAVTVAIESGDPIGKVLAEALEQATPQEIWNLAEPLRRQMPHETIALRECALLLAQLRRNRLEVKFRGTPVGKKQKADLAEAYFDLGHRLSALEENRKALIAFEKAAPLFQDLLRSDPRSAVNAVNRAGCLTNTSNQLGAIGRYVESHQRQQEGIKFLRELEKSKPGSVRGTLALALYNASITLRHLGWLNDAYRNAEESLNIYYSLEKATPDRFRPKVARSLMSVGSVLFRLGRYEEALLHAQKASLLWHELAETNPDAFQSLLADVLSDLCWYRFEIGDYKQARRDGEQAVRMLREISKFRPGAFGVRLGFALGNLSCALLRLGELRRSLEFAIESLELLKARADVEPAAMLEEVAIQSINVAQILIGLGRHQDAASYVKDALNICRKLIQERPEAVRHQLVRASTLMAQLLIVKGQLAEAHALLISEKPLLEDLRRSERARAVIPVQAEFLATLALIQLRLNELKETAENSRLATELFEESLLCLPLAYRAEASSAWCTRSSFEVAVSDMEQSQHSAVRGLELLQMDLVETPRQLSPWMLDVARDLIRLAGPLANPVAHAAVYTALPRASEGTSQ